MSEPSTWLLTARERGNPATRLDDRHARPDAEIDEYLQVIAEVAEASGGGITDPPQTVGDCPDWEDNRILDLAAAVGAFLIVSADTDLSSMSP